MKLRSALHFDWATPNGRYQVLEGCLRNVPGELGFWLRARALGRRFRRAGPGLRIFAGARIIGPGQLSVGANCWIGYDNIVQASGGVEMGDNVLLGPSVKIWSVNHVYADPYKPIIDQDYEFKPTTIGSNVWIGANVFIMPGTRIPDGAVISAGAIVGAKDYEPYSILAGNPARKVGSRLPAPDLVTPDVSPPSLDVSRIDTSRPF
jgi:maltose O-acetyltransferase